MEAFKPHIAAVPDYPYEHSPGTIKLDQNENPFSLPAELRKLLGSRLAELEFGRYPEAHAESAGAALASFEGWPAEGVVLAPGSNLLINALAAAANGVLDTQPSFAHYAIAAEIAGTPYQAVALGPDFSLPVAELGQRMLDASQPGICFLANPHAPTGKFFALEQIDTLAEIAERSGWILVVDEAYHDFAPQDYKRKALGRSQVAIMRTFSKGWGLAGVRIGYLLASPELAGIVRNLLPPFVLSAPAIAILEVCLENPGYVTETSEQIRRERERVYQSLLAHPNWRAYPSDTNFLLLRTPNAKAAFEALLQEGIVVRSQDHVPGLEGCLRVTIGTPEENDRFLAAALGLAVN